MQLVFRVFFFHTLWLLSTNLGTQFARPRPDVRGGRGVSGGDRTHARVRANSTAVRLTVHRRGDLWTPPVNCHCQSSPQSRGSGARLTRRADAPHDASPHRRTYGCEAHVTPRARGRSAPLVWLVGWLVGGVVERAGDACMAGWG
uniref:Secreted protein n=1 Tax=Oryza sativa subsp. japonica TaxID=39947 RepID=Q69P54_ORYSJ|nr:hypothetical protein [Oryza sativa Japonica Group]